MIPVLSPKQYICLAQLSDIAQTVGGRLLAGEVVLPLLSQAQSFSLLSTPHQKTVRLMQLFAVILSNLRELHSSVRFLCSSTMDLEGMLLHLNHSVLEFWA